VTDFKITGADDLEKLARRLKEEGRDDLRKELLRGIRDAGKDTIPKVREEMLRSLPRRGGFAAEAAKAPIGVRTRATGKNAGVRIARTRGDWLNRGRLRHPLYGNRGHWYQQAVPSGWFERAIEGDAPQIRAAVIKVMNDIAAKIARGL